MQVFRKIFCGIALLGWLVGLAHGAGDPARGSRVFGQCAACHSVAPVVYYIPRKDVKMERLVRTSHETSCPFKGEASYYSLKDGPENAVWTYEEPYDEMTAIKDLLAFYPDKVDTIVAETK